MLQFMFDTACLSETYLDSSIASDDGNLEMLRYNLICTITKQYGLHQVIKEPPHLLDYSSTCIDLILTSQPNLITESDIHPTLCPNFQHQIVYAKFNLQNRFFPPYSRDFWPYKDADTELIKRAIEKLHSQVYSFHKNCGNSD